MWNQPSSQELEQLPTLYSTEDIPLEEKVIHMHFFIGGCDWYAAEYDPRVRAFFGYAILNNDLQNAEWGEFSFDELREVRTRQGYEIDRDLYWLLRKANEVEKIKEAYRAQGLPLRRP